MPSWKGNPANPAPNSVQEPIDRSEKFIRPQPNVDPFLHTPVGNRATEVRRDKDSQKDPTITLEDIDETILTHLQNMQLQVEDVGKQVKVPIFYGSPQLWTSAQRDSIIRDKQGKLILPAMIFKRTSSETDPTLKFFNRYLTASVRKLYSQKNQYTKFAALVGQNVPVNEIYNVVVPSHMLLTYHFIIWTEYVIQMNKLVETIQFNTRDYWGSSKGFRFRTMIDSYTHTVEIPAGEDRVVKTEFDLSTHGYILPDTLQQLEHRRMTTQKMFSPKKIVMGVEVVATGATLDQYNINRQRWRSPNYPNLQADVPLPVPPIVVQDGSENLNISAHVVTALKFATATPPVQILQTEIPYSTAYLKVVPIPGAPPDQFGGQPLQFPYLRIVPFTSTQTSLKSPEGSVTFNDQYFYIYVAGKWERVAIDQFLPLVGCQDMNTMGQDGNVSFDSKYFYIYTKGQWRSVAISGSFLFQN